MIVVYSEERSRYEAICSYFERSKTRIVCAPQRIMERAMPPAKGFEHKPTADRFSEKYRADLAGCWVWHAGLDRHGYGVFGYKGRTWRAHRMAWVLSGRELLPDTELDHLCRNPACVNPEHLEQVSHAENLRRGNKGRGGGAAGRAKTHCPRGHEYDESNTIWMKNRKWGRQCKACAREKWREKHPDAPRRKP